AHSGDVGGVGADDLADALDHVLGGERTVLRLGVAQRVGLAHSVELLPPRGVVALASGGLVGTDRHDQIRDDLPAVAHDRHVGVPVLGDLGRVDVGVHDGGVGG